MGTKVTIQRFYMVYNYVLPLLLDHACSAPNDLYQLYEYAKALRMDDVLLHNMIVHAIFSL